MEQRQQSHYVSPKSISDLPSSELRGRDQGMHFWGDGLSAEIQATDRGRLDVDVQESKLGFSKLHTSPYPLAPEDKECLGPCRVLEPVLESREHFPLHLNVVIQVVGSRGDIQPFLAIGKSLKEHGHRVRLATHLAFKTIVLENELEFFCIGGDPVELMAFMVKNPGLLPRMSAIRSGTLKKRRGDMKTIVEGCWKSCFEASDGADLSSVGDVTEGSPKRAFVADVIIANPPSMAHVHCAEKLGIPFHMMFTMPWSPTQEFPHPLTDIRLHNTKNSVANIISYALVEMMVWEGLGDIINEFRKSWLHLDKLDAVRGPTLVQRLRIPHAYLWSPALLPKPQDWPSSINVCGFSFLPSGSDYRPPQDLATFLESGPPPIYVGFGSIVVDDPTKLTSVVFEAIRKTRQRALVSRGWSDIGRSEVPDSVLLIGDCPHDWLFKHVSCVVHHGGAGTTAIGLARGRPTVIIPFFGDQEFWGSIVARAGAGPVPLPYKEITADRLANVILKALTPAIQDKVQNIAKQIQSEQGVRNAVSSFYGHLDLDALRCSLFPARPAVWRVKHSSIRLCALAAEVLLKNKLLHLQNIELYHPIRYDTCQALQSPISATAEVLVGAFSRTVVRIVELPGDLMHALSLSCDNAPLRSDSSSNGFMSRGQKVDCHVRTCSEAEEMMELIHGYKTTLISKASKRFLDALIILPMDLTLSVSKALHEAPKLYHDREVQQIQNVFGELIYGFYYGITGVITQPRNGFKESGSKGFFKGVGKGIGGLVLKPAAGTCGIAGYSLCGLHRSLHMSLNKYTQDEIICSRIAQGQDEIVRSSAKERLEAIKQWHSLDRNEVNPV